MFCTGRHVTAAEALQLGIVDQVTDHKTVDAAVKFALGVAGETHKKNLEHIVSTCIKSSPCFKNSVSGRNGNSSQSRKCQGVGCRSQRKRKTRQADPPPQKPSMFHGSVRCALMSSHLSLYYSEGRKGTKFPIILIKGPCPSFRRMWIALHLWIRLIYTLNGLLECATSLQLMRNNFSVYVKDNPFRFAT